MAYKGRYKVKNPKKYAGDHKNVIYRSLWERRFMRWCDHTSYVMEWNSEEIVIPYTCPVTGKPRRYFPDFLVKIKKPNSAIEVWLVEVKPAKQTKPPKKPEGKVTKRNRRYLREVKTYSVNQAKWEAAIAHCNKVGWNFKIITEKTLGV